MTFPAYKIKSSDPCQNDHCGFEHISCDERSL